MKTLTLVALASAGFAGQLSAQVATLDEGSFTITVNGDRVGREDFRIRSTPGSNGPEVVATANVSYANRRVLPQMRADSAGVPVRYVVEVKDGATVDERVEGMVARGRVGAKVKNSRGESANEFVVSQGALVIDDDVFHQYYFITRRADPSGSVSVIVPRRNTQVTMRVASAGSEKLSIGGTPIDARRFTIADPGGADREVWADASGRLLKVAIPSRGVVALRDDPPR
ncbi:MAG TPA: DUF6134 family protein [Gemmatimonadaceae bacterium]|nr:DUF6134 family protein [Gemmatimonadaceae bacterium]